MLEIFSFGYFVWSFLAILLMVLLYFGFRHKSDRFQLNLLFGFTIFAWVLHFSRIWLDPDLKLYTIAFEDMCGFNTMLYPFLLKSKNRVTKDIMYFVAGLFAAHSLFYPNNIEGDPYWYYNTIRFFFAHFILVAVPVLLVAWKLHKPSLKSYPYLLVYISIAGFYVFTLSVVLVETGLAPRYFNYMGLWGGNGTVYELFEKVAFFLRYTTEVNGVPVERAIPVIYMYPGLIVFYTPVWFAMDYPLWTGWMKRRKRSD
jgi:hypothetical protein